MTTPRLPPPQQRGFTLIELCLATAMGALLLAALVHVARLATESKAELSGASEQRTEAAFVMQRLRAAADAATVSTLYPAADGDTGLWLAPTRFCINQLKALVETTSGDTTCSQGEVIAERVERLTVSLPDTQSGLDAPMVLMSVSLSRADGADSMALTQAIRMKGLLE